VKNGLIWPTIGLIIIGGLFEHDNDPLGSIKGGEFLDYLTDSKLFKKESAP
jgi:hypothetical protein